MLAPAPTAAADHSRFVQRIRRRYAAELALLPPGEPDAAAQVALIDALSSRGRPLADVLRIARQLVLERLVVLDVEQAAPLELVTRTMSGFAELALERALVQALADADARHGPPLSARGERIDFWIIGMGKLGARELNVSSDIDLVYLYEDDGETAGAPGDTTGARATSAHEYFAYVARRLQALIGDTTEHGFVFRLDLALRPNGNSGPPVVSLAMLEEYFQVQGREWERFAWLKSRVVAPRLAVTSGRALPLRALVTPFVYRRYLDYGVFDSLRALHAKIRDEATKRAAGRPGRSNDVKLARGGIREIEFIVQLLLVVRGGQFPEIRTRSTLKALDRLVAHGLMRAEAAKALADAYVLLRRIEHRIQYLDDQQTHLLPADDGDLQWIARSLGLQCDRETCELLACLGEVRERVAAEFDMVLGDKPASSPDAPCRGCGPAKAEPTPAPLDDPGLLERLPARLAERVRPWTTQPRFALLREDSRLRLGRLMQRTAEQMARGECSEDAALRFADWIEPLLRRESYFALLLERPEVQRRLLRLLGLARWPMQMLMRRPGVIDELADEQLLAERFDRDAFVAELEARREAWVRSGEANDEQLLDTLRRAHHAEVFRTLVRDVEGRLTVEQVADDLSALADAVLEVTLRWAWAGQRGRHRDAPQIAVVAYGKLGGKELGYGSDLDVVFIYDDREEPDRDRAQDIYGQFVRRVITWLTLRTAVGELFDIDTALRPNGSSGLLVSSLESFERYQVGRGSNTAWTWEHQAITRARFCAGAAALAAPVEAVRRQVLMAARDHAALRQEVQAMREKVRAARPVPPGRFDVKHSAGGMMDVEFAVQWLVLAHAAAHPALADNAGNIALLQRAEAAGLLPEGVGSAAADAYRELRRAQHRARLDEQPTQFEPALFTREAAAVQRLWASVFNVPASATAL